MGAASRTGKKWISVIVAIRPVFPDSVTFMHVNYVFCIRTVHMPVPMYIFACITRNVHVFSGHRKLCKNLMYSYA